jgi:ribosomal protein S2
MAKLERAVGGVRDLPKLPDALVLASARKEHVAVAEANIAGVPLVAVVDTNADPMVIDYPIPANDDSRRSLALIFRVLADAVIQGGDRREEKGVRREEKIEDIVDANDVAALNLSTRAQNALKKAGLTTIKKLKKMSKEDLLQVEGLGQKSVEEILAQLKKL